MAKQTEPKLNHLQREVPEGLLVDSSWLNEHGYSTALRYHYVAAGWLEHPTRGVYRRPRGSLSWEQVVVSLQNLLKYPVLVGGRTALDLQGFAHYLERRTKEVHLYGSKEPPNWLYALHVRTRFVYHNSQKLFRNDPITRGLTSLNWSAQTGQSTSNDPIHASVTTQPGPWDLPLTLSTPERAILELLDELPGRESFHQADKLFESLTSLSPRRLEKLLRDCRSVKVKRLFFFFADRHQHAWAKKIKREDFDLGKGKRMLVKGGKLDSLHQITVPEDLNGVQ
jgi:Transcriptional regulator, AbiEi antitoxin, Type IV TA system/Transcriptional regulator, AbiEi antitoxin N-terminal domain